MLGPSHGGRACGNPGAVLGGSAVWGADITAQTQTLQGHSLLAGGTMGLCGVGRQSLNYGGEGALWFSRNKILLRGSTTCGLESWDLEQAVSPGHGDTGAAAEPPPAGKQGLVVGVKVNAGGPSRPLPSLSLGQSWQTSLPHCSSPMG